MGKIDLTFSLFPKKVELQALIKYYDVNGDGQISYDEFIRGLRDDLTPRRAAMVDKAFWILDFNGSGVINYEDLKEVYDVSCNKEFIEGRKTKEQILDEFIMTFEGSQGKKDGSIAYNEWVDYYTDLSMSLPSDDYFVQMMESVWGICEHEDTQDYQNTINEYSWVTREQLLALLGKYNTKTDITKVFNDFDLTHKASITIDEFANMLAKLQIAVDRKYLRGIFRTINLSKSGCILLDEFIHFIRPDLA